MELHLSKSVLRPLRSDDAISLAFHANNIAVARNLRDVFPYPYTVEDAEFFINHIANSSKYQLVLAIEINSEVAGTIGAHFFDDVYSQNAEFGYWLGEKYWGNGIITEALNALVAFVSENYEVSRLFASVFENNIPSMRVLEKCGFEREAIHKKAVIKGGNLMDEHIFVKFIGKGL